MSAPGCAAGGGPSGNGAALLRELATLLRGLAERDEAASIDLRGIPLNLGDLQELRETLGTGEVEARINALGESHVAETSYPGIGSVSV
jgi:hydrogenase-1 operon protein HyaF